MQSMEASELMHNLACFSGSTEFHSHPMSPNTMLTEGVKYLADNTRCYWLLTLILSWQQNPKVANCPHQAWTLKKSSKGWIITATDGNRKNIAKERIESSDFPLSEIVIWFVDDVLLLPQEY